MKKTDVQLYGITYTVRATTDKGLRDGIRQLKQDIERMMGNTNETPSVSNEIKDEE